MRQIHSFHNFVFEYGVSRWLINVNNEKNRFTESQNTSAQVRSQVILLRKNESPERTWRFSKKLSVNRYIELCNPFSRFGNSFPRIGNPFPRIIQFLLSDCKLFPRI